MKPHVVLLGLDPETKGPVSEPLAHLAIFGMTRKAGKTTSLRTLVRSAAEGSEHYDALVFRTGRGEISFPGARPIPAYFHERLDWRSVEAMLWTFLSEKPKVYRPIVMKAVHGARTLEEVHRNIVAAGKRSKNGWVVDRTYELDTYFQEILPWLRGHRLVTNLTIGHGVSMVDLEGWPETVQQLVIAATLDLVLESGKRSTPLLMVLPEARSFIPSDRASPAKLAAERLARMGAKLNLFLWIDSQALTGVDQLILRNFGLLMQGVQTSDLEVSRICKAIDGVKPAMVRKLKVGDFILSTPDGVRTVHVPLIEPKVEKNVDEKERKGYEDQIASLTDTVAKLQEEVRRQHDRAEANAKLVADLHVERFNGVPSPAAIERELLGPRSDAPSAIDEPDNNTFGRPTPPSSPKERVDLNVEREVPNLTVKTKVVTIEKDDGDMLGRIGILISEGFWDDGSKRQADAGHEFVRRGYGQTFSSGGNSVRLSEAFGKMTLWGFFRKEDDGSYSLVPEARKRVKVAQVA